jgi:hypothetical protein
MSLKFKQIATSTTVDKDDEENENLYGLDDDGQVWFWAKIGWRPPIYGGG